MITSGYSFIAFIVCFAAGVFFVEEKLKLKTKFFEFIPPLVIIYFGVMLMSTFDFWSLSIDGEKTGAGIARAGVKGAILPSMIFLMLLKCDLRHIIKLGPKMLLAFFSATMSIVIGFIVTFIIFKDMLAANSWQAFGALSGSWIGGTQNMVAVQQALNLDDVGMGYTLLIDSIDYSIWIMLLLFFVGSSKLILAFNKFNKADTRIVEELSQRLAKIDDKVSKEVTFLDLFGTLAFALGAGALCVWIAQYLPQTTFLNNTTWSILLVTIMGIVGGMSPLSKVPGTKQLSNIFLYIMIGLIASSANFAELTEAPVYIIAGACILAIHAAIMLVIAKIFKLDLFTCCVASVANIGGVASAPVIAGAYNDSLVPVGVLMGMLGAIVGTGMGLLVAKILFMLV
ncbi:MAG: DUF819 domain-containing protein [Aliivibrio sp.]|uniref:DUF819 family protein n=1 Tax=Aliivibrio sp. TaxID=1872443 RepID=UPI001A48C55A|nr:DUF819 domain-containing protein [Aliivibrio sp.]